MQLVNRIHLKNLRGDVFGGVTAAIVALPLALAFGVSSGAGPIAGLYGAIATGFFAALCGGTPSQITGPTGPMTVVMATIIAAVTAQDAETGLATAFTIVILGGLFQILFGVLRLGKYITLMPYTVISGFMSGIGVIIIIIEVAPFLGYPNVAGVVASFRAIPREILHPEPFATGLGIFTLALVFFAPAKLNRIIPSPLLALIVGTLISVLVFPDSDIPRIGDIPSGFPKLNFPVFSWEKLNFIVGYGLMLAVLGAIDSLLTSLVADNITRTQHESDRELIGQGIGNTISGLLGGLPGAGATMRTVINVQAGGKTPLSGIIHAAILLAVVLGAGSLTESIPHTVLAGILIKVGIDIIDWGFLKRAHLVSKKAAVIMYSVMLLTVFVDLIVAVAVGVFVANILTIERLSNLQSEKVNIVTDIHGEIPLQSEEREILKGAKGAILLFHLGGPMSFGAAKSISRRMSIVQHYEVLILDITDVTLLGITASLAVETMIKDAIAQRRNVYIVGANGQAKERLQKLKVLDLLPLNNQLDQRLDALRQANLFLNPSWAEDRETTNV